MVDTKYDLYSAISRDTKIYNKPWWKERLKGKYIRSLDPQGKAVYFDVKSWTFMKDGFDDFRDGLPPVFDDGAFIKGDKELRPNTISGNGKSDHATGCSRKTLSKIDTCFSKKSPLQEQRLDQVNQIERGLIQHPLALYPHLEDCLPPDLFEDVVEILDPEMKYVLDEDNFEAEMEQGESEINCKLSASRKQQSSPLKENEETELSDEIDARAYRNPYCWLPRAEEKEKKDKKKNLEIHKRGSHNEDENIRKVTTEFCNWVSGLGGDSNNIEESTVTSLFASGYETKPALSVPIHVVELTNVPPELRTSAQGSVVLATSSDNSPDHQAQVTDDYVPSWIKFKYGAWYLKPKTWKVRPAGEPLCDAKDTKDKEMSEAKKKSLNLDYDLAVMHGTKLFKDFVDRKDARKPQFLQHIAQIHAEQGQDEQEAKTPADHVKIKRLSASKHPK